jgi:hypothetical protein
MLWLIDHFEALKDHVSENYIDMFRILMNPATES